MCARCNEREKRGFEKRPCKKAECPYKHLGYTDPVEVAFADMRNVLRSRGIGKLNDSLP